eukprot:COSAG06_NODE_6179_length_3064_cov_2.385160_2_plen_326_part_00
MIILPRQARESIGKTQKRVPFPCRSDLLHERGHAGKKMPFLPVLCLNSNICQGRLGTKIGKTCLNEDAFVMQNLFMQPCIREVVLRAVPSAAELQNIKPEDSAFFQVRAARPSSSFISGAFRAVFNFWNLSLSAGATAVHPPQPLYAGVLQPAWFLQGVQGRQTTQKTKCPTVVVFSINCIDHAAIPCRFYQHRLRTLSVMFFDFIGQDYDGQPIPLHEHQDGFEFFNRLVDQVEKTNVILRRPFILKMIFVLRQARDKHREEEHSQKRIVFWTRWMTTWRRARSQRCSRARWGARLRSRSRPRRGPCSPRRSRCDRNPTTIFSL